MPDPRNTVAFDEVATRRVTYKIDNVTIIYDKTKTKGSAQVGFAVGLSDDGIVELVNDNNVIEGKLDEVFPDNKASVIVDGYAFLPAGAAAAVAIGRKVIGALGPAGARGFVKAVPAASAPPTQAEVNAALNGRGAIVANDDTTKLVIRL